MSAKATEDPMDGACDEYGGFDESRRRKDTEEVMRWFATFFEGLMKRSA